VGGSSVDVVSAPPVDGAVRTGLGWAVHVGVIAPVGPPIRLERAVVRCATGLRTAGGPGAAALW